MPAECLAVHSAYSRELIALVPSIRESAASSRFSCNWLQQLARYVLRNDVPPAAVLRRVRSRPTRPSSRSDVSIDSLSDVRECTQCNATHIRVRVERRAYTSAFTTCLSLLQSTRLELKAAHSCVGRDTLAFPNACCHAHSRDTLDDAVDTDRRPGRAEPNRAEPPQ